MTPRAGAPHPGTPRAGPAHAPRRAERSGAAMSTDGNGGGDGHGREAGQGRAGPDVPLCLSDLIETFRAQLRDDPDVASAVAAIRALLGFLKQDRGGPGSPPEPRLAPGRALTEVCASPQGKPSRACGTACGTPSTPCRGWTRRWPCPPAGSCSCASSASRPWSTR